jgi:abortive infection bacteriophage resistance protein
MTIFVATDPATLPIRTASHGGAFLFMAVVPLNKSARSVSDQLLLLQQRGLVINDMATATRFLTHVGYYRLVGYWNIFQTNTITHTFAQGTRFEDVIRHYDFDRGLRLLVYDGIERIEVSFRTQIVDMLCMSYGAYWYTESQYSQDPKFFQDNLTKAEEELDRSKKNLSSIIT